MNVSLRRSLKTDRKSKDSSIKCYESNFLFMKKKFNVRSVITENWINKNIDLVLNTYLEELENEKISHAKFIAQLTCLLLTLSPKGRKQPKKKYEHLYNRVNDLVVKHNNDYAAKKSKQEKTQKEEDNWINHDDIVAYVKKNEPIAIKAFKANKNKTTFLNLQQILIMRLYSDIPPRRLDYQNMTIMDYKDYSNPAFKKHIRSRNLWVYHKQKSKGSFFSFGVALPKTQAYVKDDDDAVIWECPKQIQKLIYLLRTHQGEKSLLYNTKLKAINKSSLSKLISKAFKNAFNKNVGSSMLRKIYDSNKFKNDVPLEERIKIARMMNHSIMVSMTHYTKH
jgi:hypothetical protein